ncbi:MAG: NAD(+)/NADH kinase [Kiritimatiellae bacterium]|nr:NAD(+)/NADH kinase [Kiritimatiellia bacterium]
MKTIGVIANCRKPDTRAALERLLKKARAMKAAIVSCDETADQLPGIERVSEEQMAKRSNVLIAMGGDGTMLRAVRLLGGRETPVLGVNLGGLGFMTAVPEADIERALDAVRKGKYALSNRTLISCRILRRGRALGKYEALNDIAIGWGDSSRVATLGVAIDGEDVTSYVCDGLVISTPTGSTGHSLSAGGPIMPPDTEAFVLCPICPHTLSNRPLVIADTSQVAVTVIESPKDLLVTWDGQGHAVLAQGDRIEVKKSAHTARFILLPGYSYYALLRQKLHWRGSSL